MDSKDSEDFGNGFSFAHHPTLKSTDTDILSFIKEKSFTTTTAIIVCKVTLALFLFSTRFGLFKRRLKSGYKSYSETVPRFQWIPYIKIPFLDVIIAFYKVRKCGVRFLDTVVSMCGPNSRMIIGTWTVTGVSDPEIIKKLLNSTNPAHFNKSSLIYNRLFTRLMKNGLVVSKFDFWSPHRKALSPAFTYKSFPIYLKFTINSAKIIIDEACRIADSDKNKGEIDNNTMQKLIDHHSVKIATDIIMGPDKCNLSDNQTTVLHNNIKRWKAAATERILRPEFLFPPLWWITPIKKVFDSAIYEITQLSYQIADQYRQKKHLKEKLDERQTTKEISTKEETFGVKPYECLMEKMIKSEFSNKEISDEVATFLIAGHEAVKVALEFLIFHLSANKIHQKLCQMEVDDLFNSVKAANRESEFDLEDFSQLKYLDRCISESMRITPPFPFIMRDLNDPLEVTENLAFPAGESIFVIIWSLHRNESIYPNPEKYDPDRFLPENVKQRHPYAYIPFSMGVRNCIGWKVALLEIKVIMAWILRHFEMTTTDSLNDVKILFDMSIKTERPYNVTFKRRPVKENLN